MAKKETTEKLAEIREVVKPLTGLIEKLRRAQDNAVVRAQADEIGEIDGHEYWIVESPVAREWRALPPEKRGGVPQLAGLNGYIVFKKKPVKEKGYNGILSYVPVHGGITYAHHDSVGSVYGFDTAHWDSHLYPTFSHAWVRRQIGVMLRGIQLAAKLEKRYLKAKTGEDQQKVAAELDLEDSE